MAKGHFRVSRFDVRGVRRMTGVTEIEQASTLLRARRLARGFWSRGVYSSIIIWDEAGQIADLSDAETMRLCQAEWRG